MSTITAYKCTNCGHVMFPHHLRCLNCNERDFDEIEPEGKAKLLTYTIINELPWGLDERGRVLGIVEFENGIRALGLIKSEKVKLGMKLDASMEPVRVIGGEQVLGLTLS